MNRQRGQVGIEHLVLSIFILVVISGLYVLSNQVLGETLEQNKIEASLAKLETTINEVHANGCGSSQLITLELPSRVNGSSVSNQQISITLTTLTGDISQMGKYFSFPISGNIPVQKGNEKTKILVKALCNNSVQLDSELFLYPLTVNGKGTSGNHFNQPFELENVSNGTLTGISCAGTGDLSVMNLSGVPASLNAGEKVSFTTETSIVGTGVFTGTVDCSATQGQTVSTAVTLSITS